MYNITQTGLGAEYVIFDSSPDVDMSLGARHNLLRPEAVEALFYAYRATYNETYREWGWMMFQVMRIGRRIFACLSLNSPVIHNPSILLDLNDALLPGIRKVLQGL